MTETKKERDLFTRVNTPQDSNNMTDLEKKHLPVITAPEEVKPGECFQVTVEVGKLLKHPNERAHFIGVIDLYAGELYLTRLDLTPVSTCPTLKTCVSLAGNVGPLRAYAVCNLHGTWSFEKPITVKQ